MWLGVSLTDSKFRDVSHQLVDPIILFFTEFGQTPENL